MVGKSKLRGFAAFVVALSWACALTTTGARAADPALTPLVADVLWPPHPVLGSDSLYHLVYELRLANPTPTVIGLASVDVLDANGQVLLHLAKEDIAKRFSIGGRRGAEAAELGIGQFGVLFLDVSTAGSSAAPGAVTHRISGRLVTPGKEFAITVAATSPTPYDPVVLGPPLKGRGFIAADGCCDSIRHVRALLPIDGRLTLAQRFAIDREQVAADNRLVHGPVDKVENYNIYGQDVYAVADGTVIETRNDLSDQKPGKLPENLPLDEADGNFVVLKIKDGVYALYAHLQKGSVTVAPGAIVNRGRVLGTVGNTGNTSAPHLHFHVMDGPSPLVSNGLPYVLDTFRMSAIDKAGTADFDKAEETGSALDLTPVTPPKEYGRVLPLDLTVVEFP